MQADGQEGFLDVGAVDHVAAPEPAQHVADCRHRERSGDDGGVETERRHGKEVSGRVSKGASHRAHRILPEE